MFTSYNKGPQPSVVHERADLPNKVEKLIIFPTTDFQGKDTQSSKAVDASVNASWIKFYGKNSVIPAGLIVKKVIDFTGGDTTVNSSQLLITLVQLNKLPNKQVLKPNSTLLLQ